MAERTSYAPGTFSWVDLATTDPGGAKAFYSELFDWSPEDMPTGNGGTYTMFRLRGQYVAATSEQQEQERSQGIPPHWNSYVTVDDVDQRATRASELGGSVIAPPFDVLEVGRMAAVADPTGAVLSLWEPKTHIGAGLVNAPGGLSWNELGTNDVAKAKDFYSGLFGWSMDDQEGSMGSYTMIQNGERANGGIRALSEQEQGVPSNWLVYFGVSSVDDTAAKAAELGASTLVPPTEIPIGKFAVLADPQGAVFALFAGDFDD